MSINPLTSQSVYESLFKHSQSIMLIIDPETGDILDANLAALKFYQYSENEILALKTSEINTLSEKELIKEMKETRLNKSNYYNFQHRLKTGEIRDVEVYSGPIEFGDKKVLYSIVHDISEKKLAQETLKKNESTIRAMINATKSMVYLFDINGVIINLNTPGALLFDKSPDEMIGKNFKIFFKKKEFSRLGVLIKDVVENQEPVSYQKESRGRHYDVQLYPVFNEYDQVDRICVFANDITDLKQTEKAFAAIETAGGICHEMNQPLQVILGNLEIIKMNMKKTDPNLALVNTILSQTEKLGQITKKLAHITRYETKGYIKGTIFDIDKSSRAQ